MSSLTDIERNTIQGVSMKYGIPREKVIKLDMNENLFIQKAFLQNVLKEVIFRTDPRLYPIDSQERFISKLCGTIGVNSDQVMIGTGGDQLLDIAFRFYTREVKQVLTIAPTFSMYEKFAIVSGMKYRKIGLRQDFSLDLKQLIEKTNPQNTLLLLCSPNNPTGNQFSRDEIRFILDSYKGPIMVDEAYVDFADYDASGYVDEYENLIILRSFSKSYGLAGLRLGYLVGNAASILAMKEFSQIPYPCSTISLETASVLLDHQRYFKNSIDYLRKERDRFISKMEKIEGVQPFQSDSNFILLNLVKEWKEVVQTLLERGVIVRGIGKILTYPNCIRVTAGSKKMNERFLEILQEVVS